MTDSKRGLFLDFDGTLADSVPLLRTAYHQFMRNFGIDSSDDEFAALMGPTLEEVVRKLKEKYALEPDQAELERQYRQLIWDFYTQSQPNPGAADVLKRATDQGWVVVVVTSGAEADVKRWLDHHQLETYVSYIVGAEHVTRGKPDPEPYRVALQQQEFDVSRSIALEDAPKGAMSAVAAGLATYILGPNPASPKGTQNWPEVAGFVESFEQLAKTVLHV